MTGLADVRDRLEVARGQLVILREKHLDDAPNDFAWARDPEIARLNDRDVTSETYTQFLAQFEYDLRYPSPRQHMLAIDTLSGDQIGNAMYYNASSGADSAEFGITLGAAAYRGRGYGREATTLFLRHLWQTTPFRSISLHTLASNEPALRCFRACGFEPVGGMQSGAVDLVRMAVRRERWLFDDSRGAFNHASAPRAAGVDSPDHT